MLLTAIQLALVSGVVGLGYILFGGYLFRQYEGIGVESLGAFSIVWGGSFVVQSALIFVFASFGITDGAQLVQVQSTVPTAIQATLVGMDLLSGLLTVAGIFIWLWFVLRYTQRISSREKIAVGVIGGITFFVVMINGLVGAVDTFGLIEIQPSLRRGVHQFGSVVEVLGMGVGVGVGIALLYATATNHRPFREAAVVGLSVPIIVPWLVRYLYQFGLVTGFRSISALHIVGLSVGLVGLWMTVTKYDLFEQLPASRAVGRQTAFKASDTALVVVNNQHNISDINPAASDLFSESALDCIGTPFDELLPETVDSSDFRESEPTIFRMPDSETVVEAVMTTATDDSGTAIGRTIVFTDITAERRRQQRIQVLNRILRHNLRNDLNAAKGYVGVMSDGGPETDTYQHKVETILDDLVTIGKKAQSTEQVLNAEPLSDSPTQLGMLIEDAIESVRSEYESVSITGSVPASISVRINPTVIGLVIEELIENAVRHTDSEITIGYEADSSTLIVADHGPGIPEHETTALDRDQETDLQHGSGIGLWLVKWGTESFGGTVVFDTDETGTQARISIPTDLVEEMD